MVSVPVDSAHVTLEFKNDHRKKLWGVELNNLKIQNTPITQVQHFDQLTKFLSTDYRDFQGQPVPADSLKSEFRIKAQAAFTNNELSQVVLEQLKDLRQRGLIHSYDPALKAGNRDSDLRLKASQSAIDSLLINGTGGPKGYGHLWPRTMYFRHVGMDHLEEHGTHSLKRLPADTRVILDLRLPQSGMVPNSHYDFLAEMKRWDEARQWGAVLVSEPKELISMRWSENFSVPSGGSHPLESADDKGWRKIMLRPNHGLKNLGEIIVLINEGSDLTKVLAMKGAPGVTVIGRTARRMVRYRDGAPMANNPNYKFCTGEYRTANGDNPLADGVAPDILVPEQPHGDPIFEKALEILGLAP